MRRAGRIAVTSAYTAAFWVALPWALWTAARWIDRTFGWTAGAHPVAGAPVLGGALGLVAWAMYQLNVEGRGLPVSALPPSRLAHAGPYRYARHPIYVGFNLAICGAGLLLGSRALATVVALLFLPCWVAYALVEERWLVRRFGGRYRAYQRRVGLLPRLEVYAAGWILLLTRVVPVRVLGRHRIPRRGAAVLVANHASYLDFVFVGAAVMPRRLSHTVTAEAYRSPVARRLLSRVLTVPVRRYRTDPRACREILRMIDAGHLLYLAPEGERATLGRRLPPLREVARIVARLPCPVIPVGISGAYDFGPRWAGVLRRRLITVRVGDPIRFGGGDPVRAIDDALRRLVACDPQPVRMRGIPAGSLARVLWRCPACLDEHSWSAERLACAACGARWRPTAAGLFRRGDQVVTLAELADRVWCAEERSPLRVEVTAWRERSMWGPIDPLLPLGPGELEIGPGSLRFGSLVLPLHSLRSVTTERNDTLQVATARSMWQFRVRTGSAFRLQNAVERWRAVQTTREAALP